MTTNHPTPKGLTMTHHQCHEDCSERDYHRGFADGFDMLAAELATIAQEKRPGYPGMILPDPTNPDTLISDDPWAHDRWDTLTAERDAAQAALAIAQLAPATVERLTVERDAARAHEKRFVGLAVEQTRDARESRDLARRELEAMTAMRNRFASQLKELRAANRTLRKERTQARQAALSPGPRELTILVDGVHLMSFGTIPSVRPASLCDSSATFPDANND